MCFPEGRTRWKVVEWERFLAELTWRQLDAGIPSTMLLVPYGWGTEWGVWTREQVTQCLRLGLEKVTRR